MLTTESQILSEITTHLKYAKFVPEKNRRETWGELVTRNKEMHLKKFPQLAEEIEAAYKYVYDKKILPSMRSMQFAGKPIEINNARILTVLIYQLMITEHFLKSCSCYFQVVELDIQFKPTT